MDDSAGRNGASRKSLLREFNIMDSKDHPESGAESERLPIDRAAIVRALAHDLRQPQNALTAALAALKLDAPKLALLDKTHLVRLHTAEVAHREQIWITDQILDFLRVLTPELRPAQKPVPLQLALQAACSTYELLARERGIGLVIRPTTVTVLSDPQYLHRVVGNLVANAIRHSRGTVALLGVRRRGDGCVIEVRDNGQGIPCVRIEDIFEPGWRGEPPPGTPKAAGTGLGLYIVRATVQALEGSVEVSTAPGKGTCFRVYLPGPVTRSTSILQWPRAEVGSLAGKVVAILDDQRAVVDSMRALFEKYGATVVAEDNDLDFLAQLAVLPSTPDLFILDFMLGATTTAVRTLQMLRQRFGYEKVKAIILTANTAHPDLKNIPNTPIIEKPLSPNNLENIVAYLAGSLPWDPARFS